MEGHLATHGVLRDIAKMPPRPVTKKAANLDRSEAQLSLGA